MYLSRRAPPIAATLMKKRPHGRVRSSPPGWLGGHLLTPTRSSKAGVLVLLLTPSMSLPKMSAAAQENPERETLRGSQRFAATQQPAGVAGNGEASRRLRALM